MSDEKKNRELTVFEDTLCFTRSCGGEGRRNVNRLNGSVDRSSERPDIVINAEDGRIIGIEHFRVDQLIKNDKKVQSAAAEFVSSIEDERTRIVGDKDVDHLELTDEMLDMFGRNAAKGIFLTKNSKISDLAKSLEAGLFGDRGHAKKLDEYRCNLLTINNDAKVELGYLIEFHSELSSLILNEGTSSHQLVSGEMPLFPDLYDLLERAARNVDWILLAFYPNLRSEMVGAAVARCSNGMFRKSLERQGLKRTECFGCVDGSPFVRQQRKGDSRYSIEGEAIHYDFESNPDPAVIYDIVDRSTGEAAKALELARDGKPFAATIAVQYWYELVRDRAKSRKGVKASDVCDVLRKMDRRERERRSKAFEAKYFPDQLTASSEVASV